MNSKNVFFIIFVTIIIFSEQAAHAAAGSLLRLAIRSGCMKSTQHVRTYASSFDKLRTYGHAGFIDDYHPEDEAYIAPIAIKHMFKLTNSSVYQDDAHKAWEQEIAVALSSPAITSKVYRNHDGIPVAFINYEVQEPSSFAKWLPEKLSGSTGHIRHMAVADEHQGCGIGGELLEEAMRVCEEHGVCCIELGTTGYPSKDLVKFYRNAGFCVVKEPGRYSTCGDTKWQKQIRPNLVGLVDGCVEGAGQILWWVVSGGFIFWFCSDDTTKPSRVDCADDDS